MWSRLGEEGILAKHREHESHDATVRLWRIALGYRYVILATFAIGLIAAAVTGYLLTPVYRATALVMIEDEMAKIVGMQGVIPAELPRDWQHRTECTLITSRNVLRAAARQLQPGAKGPPASADRGMLLGVKITASPIQRTRLIRVSAEGPDKEKVDDIVNAVVDAFREDTIQRSRNSSAFATGWVSEQLPRLRAEVLAAEGRLHKFQKENKVLSLDRTHDIVSQRLAQLNQDLTMAEKTRRELEVELAQIEAADDEAIDFLPVVAENATVRELDAQILSLQSQKTDLLQTVRPDHRDVKVLDAKTADLRARRRTTVRGVLASVRRRLGSARVNEQMVRQALAEQEKKALELNEKLVELNALERDVERANQLYEPLLERWGKLDLASGLNADPVQIIERAEEPVGPVKPRKQLILLAGAFLGLLAGFQLAFILDRAYSKVRSAEELERGAGVRAIGAIPHMAEKDEKARFMICVHDRKSAAAEAYRSIRTGLLLAASGDGTPVFLVTSAVDEEGKTTTATNVAAALAQTQKRVLLVDGDMRRSSVHRVFGMEKDQGLSTCLADGVDAKEVVKESEVPSLSVVTAGASPENPSELLGSDRMHTFLEWARQNFDYVVIDSPPVAAVTDASVLAPQVDAILMVVRAERTPRRAVSHGRELLENAKGRITGAILNDIPRKHGGYYGYYGYYRYGRYDRYYGQSEEEKEG